MSVRPTVFLVDDDAALRKGLSLSLAERGFTVEGFDSAEHFLGEVTPDRPGCLLLDVRMPRMSGPELHDQLLQRGFELPIVFISGHGDIPQAVRAMRKGAFDFLEKPYQLDRLVQAVVNALAEDQRLRQADAERASIRARFERTTRREREVMALIVAGSAALSNREVAERLDISQRTVETYRARMMEKMQARSLIELVEMAKICGVYNPEEP